MDDKANELALEAVQKLDTGVFKIYATLDIDRPETIDNFAKFGEVLLDAYKKGVADRSKDEPSIADYEEAATDHKRLVRELDVLLNGSLAAKQASLCDIVSQVRREMSATQSTDMARRLRKLADDPMWANHAEVSKNTLIAAAYEIDRYYIGMVNWKKTAEAKDVRPVQHPDDIAIDKFAEAMKKKMAATRARGRGGWEDKNDCSTELLQELLWNHVIKGDPVDVGNLAMMLFNRDERSAINDASGMRPMLEILQAGEMSVARAIEIIELWMVGHYTADDLPSPEPLLVMTTPVEKAKLRAWIESLNKGIKLCNANGHRGDAETINDVIKHFLPSPE